MHEFPKLSGVLLRISIFLLIIAYPLNWPQIVLLGFTEENSIFLLRRGKWFCLCRLKVLGLKCRCGRQYEFLRLPQFKYK